MRAIFFLAAGILVGITSAVAGGMWLFKDLITGSLESGGDSERGDGTDEDPLHPDEILN